MQEDRSPESVRLAHIDKVIGPYPNIRKPWRDALEHEEEDVDQKEHEGDFLSGWHSDHASQDSL
eukprot:CAMPEP_0184495402 /NCGR_PEP_ID=MMETSP0113_2-20130426/31210_1 /TAXON_ID=91329 /ORGANISM="Norrisiella sphaerica, Strain BC52" /LENGTH=63 /DNA_ID=CAMNT_0026881573 /DNA_START=640 /DNA_END=831 /DNA_ORIENTATION=-